MTDKTQRNHELTARAVAILRGGSATVGPEFRWLVDESAGIFRRTVLAGLGRIGDPSQLREAAAALCLCQPSTAEALRHITRLRGVARPRRPRVDPAAT